MVEKEQVKLIKKGQLAEKKAEAKPNKKGNEQS
jgi:hypothetical protein